MYYTKHNRLSWYK